MPIRFNPLWNILIVFTASCFILAGCEQQPKIAPLAPGAVILAFGDSLTYGTGAPRGQSYPAQLERSLNYRVINAGVPGEVSANGLSRLPGLIEKFQPDLVIICHGGNDFLRRNSTNKIKKNLRQMVSLTKGRGIDVILVSVPQLGLLLSPASLYTEIAEEFNVPLEKETLTEILSEPSLKSDHIHPNARGYGKMAEAFANLIEKSQE